MKALEQMQNQLNMLIENKNVLSIAGQIVRGEIEDRSRDQAEESKADRPSDVPLTNLEGRMRVAINEDDDDERFSEPLISRAAQVA